MAGLFCLKPQPKLSEGGKQACVAGRNFGAVVLCTKVKRFLHLVEATTANCNYLTTYLVLKKVRRQEKYTTFKRSDVKCKMWDFEDT